MKKIILTTAAVAVLSSSTVFAVEDTFYGKIQLGGLKLNEESLGKDSKKYKSDNDFMIGASLGYYIMDNVRGELSFDHIVDPKLKAKNSDFESKMALQVNSLLANVYFDAFDASAFKVFLGVGAGVAQVEGKVPLKTKDGKGTVNAKAKDKTNFAYAGYVGTSAEIAPGINAELTYSYRGFDKTKKFKNNDAGVATDKGYEVKGHFLTVGLRFDF